MKQTDTAHDVQSLLQSLGLLIRRVRSATSSQELSLSEAAVLGRLEREGPATTAELARAESMKPQSMGATIAGLEEMGLLERHPHPTDRRQVHLSLTAKGVAVRSSIKTAKRNWLEQAITKLPARDREKLFEAAEIIRRLAEQDTE